MTSFRTIGTGARVELDRLRDLLCERGATHADRGAVADLWLIGVDTLAEASSVLESLGTSERSKALLVGVPGTLDVRQPATAGTLAGLLETFRPFGVLAVGGEWKPELAGFIGTKELADRMEAGYMKQLSSRHYGSWLRCDGAELHSSFWV